ncbi:MAG: hypothetical protein U0X75_18345 [Acidobacteriota bacterium]
MLKDVQFAVLGNVLATSFGEFRRRMPLAEQTAANVCRKPSAADSTSLPTIIVVRDATVGPLFGTLAIVRLSDFNLTEINT